MNNISIEKLNNERKILLVLLLFAIISIVGTLLIIFYMIFIKFNSNVLSYSTMSLIISIILLILYNVLYKKYCYKYFNAYLKIISNNDNIEDIQQISNPEIVSKKALEELNLKPIKAGLKKTRTVQQTNGLIAKYNNIYFKQAKLKIRYSEVTELLFYDKLYTKSMDIFNGIIIGLDNQLSTKSLLITNISNRKIQGLNYLVAKGNNYSITSDVKNYTLDEKLNIKIEKIINLLIGKKFLIYLNNDNIYIGINDYHWFEPSILNNVDPIEQMNLILNIIDIFKS